MKTFIIEYQNLETRLDVDFYNPLYTTLENIIKSKTSTVLGDYIVELSGGATPKKKMYSQIIVTPKTVYHFLECKISKKKG